MVTKNQRVAAYLPEGLKEAFNKFKQERELGDSQALIAILSEFLGVSQQVTHQVSLELTQRIEALENKLTTLRDELLSELSSRLLLVDAEVQSTSSSNGELPKKETIFTEPATQTNIFGDSDSELLDKEITPVESSKSPEAEIVSASDSLTDTSAVVKRKRGRPKASGIPDDGTLSTTELAKRLDGLTYTQLSQWKPGSRREKPSEKVLEITRKADPEGIGWTYIPESNRYKPEREITSNSPQLLQSELLNDAPDMIDASGSAGEQPVAGGNTHER